MLDKQHAGQAKPSDHNFHPRYRPDIDGLRAVAVLSVVVFHAFPGWLPGGYIGVDIFFVISGFLISSIIFRSLERGDFRFAEFYAHRVKRIFPALILVMVTTFAFGYFALLLDALKLLGKHMLFSAGFLENFLLNGEDGYFDVRSELKPLMHLWSLGIEEQFYLAYPFIIWLGWRLGINLLLVTLAIAVISFAMNVHGIGDDEVATFFLPHTRFWELMAGCILAWINFHQRQRIESWFGSVQMPAGGRGCIWAGTGKLSTLGLGLIVVALLLLDRDKAFPGWWALLPVLGAWLAIAAGMHGGVNARILGHPVLVWVGLISYPLYLWHWPLLTYARILESGTPTFWLRAAAVVLAILLAWLTYRLVERPIRFGRNTWLKTAVLCVLLLAVGLLGQFSKKSEGFPERAQGLEDIHAQLRWPEKRPRTDSCLQAYPEMAKGFCAQAGSGAVQTVLIGDSHAGHLYPGLAGTEGPGIGSFLLLGNTSCPPFFDIGIRKLNGKGSSCPEVNAALAAVLADSRVETVVLAFYGVKYMTGKGFGEEDTREQEIRLTVEGRLATAPQSEVFEQAMRNTLGRLLAAGKRVVVVLDPPELGFNPRSCFDFDTALVHKPAKTVPCAVSRERVEARNREYRALLNRVFADFPSVEVFDPLPYFCDDEYCRAMKDDRILYRDQHHLSLQGSKYFTRAMIEALGRH